MDQAHETDDLLVQCGTHTGLVRQSNQDFYGKYLGAFGALYIVCDGMGGYAGGEIASQLAVETIAGHFAGLGSGYDEIAELKASFLSADEMIRDYRAERPEIASMGTTVVAILIKGSRYWYAWAGDSRIYLLRRNILKRVTRDHSYVQELVDAGEISKDEAREHPQRNRITHALGGKDPRGEFAGPFSVFKGDTFLLCSDGLTEHLTDNEIEHSLGQNTQDPVNELINKALELGGSDNVTLITIRANHGEPLPKQDEPDGYNIVSLSLICATVIVFIMIIGTGIRIYARQAKDRDAIEAISRAEMISQEDTLSHELSPRAVLAEEQVTHIRKPKPRLIQPLPQADTELIPPATASGTVSVDPTSPDTGIDTEAKVETPTQTVGE